MLRTVKYVNVRDLRITWRLRTADTYSLHRAEVLLCAGSVLPALNQELVQPLVVEEVDPAFVVQIATAERTTRGLLWTLSRRTEW
jgi:hypothetical protein